MGAFLRGSGILKLACLVYTNLSTEYELNSFLHKLYVGNSTCLDFFQPQHEISCLNVESFSIS